MEVLKPPEHIDFRSGNVAARWQRWKRQFEVYYDACEISKKPKATQVAILLHAAGPEAQDVHDAFAWADGEDKADYKLILQKFDEYSEPMKNVVCERYAFWSRNQKEGEQIDTWLTDLKNSAAKCEFGNQETSVDLLRVIVTIRSTLLTVL